MTDEDALRAAIVDAPDSDLPRLVYADFIQERGDEDGADFIRAQIELANSAEYEPFAIHCHSHRPDWVTGESRRLTLPQVPGLEWVPGQSFRRGFGYTIAVQFLPFLQKVVPYLREREPVQALALGTASLDQWQEFATAPWLPDIRTISFTGLDMPTEPIYVLCSTPAASGLRTLNFSRGDSPGMPYMLERVFTSPLGHGLKSLSVRYSTEQSRELIEGLAGGARSLTELNLSRISWPWNAVIVLVQSGLLGQLRILRLTETYISAGCLSDLAESPLAAGLEVLELPNDSLRQNAIEVLVDSPFFTGLKKLNLNENSLGPQGARLLAEERPGAGLPSLRSLLLRQTETDNAGVRFLTCSQFWQHLTELDLTRNPIDDHGASHLLTAMTPPELTSLRLSVNRFAESVRDDLIAKYGPAVQFVADG